MCSGSISIYLLYELTQAIKTSRPERPFSYEVKFERAKLKQRAKKKQNNH